MLDTNNVGHLKQSMTKPTNRHVHPAKTPISLAFHLVRSVTTVRPKKVGSLATHNVHSKDSDQTWQLPRHTKYFVGFVMLRLIWVASRENLFMPYANNNGADQSAHPNSLISAFVVRCLDSSAYYSRNFKTLASFCGCAGGFESSKVTNPEDRFSRDEAHLLFI